MRSSARSGITVILTVCRFDCHDPVPMSVLMVAQMSITESKGVEGRGSYFNGTGVIRDVMQNRKSPCRVCL